MDIIQILSSASATSILGYMLFWLLTEGKNIIKSLVTALRELKEEIAELRGAILILVSAERPDLPVEKIDNVRDFAEAAKKPAKPAGKAAPARASKTATTQAK